MKLSTYAKLNNITYRTAYRHWQRGIVKGRQLVTGTIVIDDEPKSDMTVDKVALYARVSSSENKDNLYSQMERLRNFACAKGYTILHEVSEIGSGLNDERKKLLTLLDKDDYSIIIVEHKDRFARFGVNMVEKLLAKLNKKLLIINQTSNDRDDLMQDFVSIITSFTARLYGLRRSKRRTEKIIKELEADKCD